MSEASEQLVLVYFFVAWDAWHKENTNVLEEMAKSYDIMFLLIDIEEANDDTANAFGIYASPTFVCLHNRDEVSRLVGTNPDELRKLIDTARRMTTTN